MSVCLNQHSLCLTTETFHWEGFGRPETNNKDSVWTGRFVFPLCILHYVVFTVSTVTLFYNCVHCLSQGAECGAGERGQHNKVSSEEAVVGLCHRGAAEEDWSQSWRPAADRGWFPPHCGRRVTDIKPTLL